MFIFKFLRKSIALKWAGKNITTPRRSNSVTPSKSIPLLTNAVPPTVPPAVHSPAHSNLHSPPSTPYVTNGLLSNIVPLAFLATFFSSKDLISSLLIASGFFLGLLCIASLFVPFVGPGIISSVILAGLTFLCFYGYSLRKKRNAANAASTGTDIETESQNLKEESLDDNLKHVNGKGKDEYGNENRTKDIATTDRLVKNDSFSEHVDVSDYKHSEKPNNSSNADGLNNSKGDFDRTGNAIDLSNPKIDIKGYQEENDEFRGDRIKADTTPDTVPTPITTIHVDPIYEKKRDVKSQ